MKERIKVVKYDWIDKFKVLDKNENLSQGQKSFLEQKVLRAMKKDEFKLFLQGQFDAKNEAICGAEALVRWEIEKGKYLLPCSFLDLFEKNGVILKLDYYMFDKVCGLIKSWIDSSIKPICVSVNFSRQHVLTGDWVENLSNITQKHRVPKNLVNIEITESFALENERMLIDKAEKLKGMGFNLSIDDFGTGYSSLSILGSLPVNEIKLDRSFFTKGNLSEKTDYIVKHIILMAKSLGLKTVAEGIEEERQVKKLKKLDCDVIQGYYFAKPVPAGEFFIS